MALTAKQRRRARYAGMAIGAILGLTIGVVLPMWGNYQDHGSVFLAASPQTGEP